MDMKTPEEIEKYWTDKIKKQLVGRTITSVQYLSREDAREDWDWSDRSLIIMFDDNSWIMPMSDDEGNNGGALATSESKLLTIPVI
tara:strand:+ start:58 stop:315 length:258 start_codon:yes stop_codon:yes gene_type:complete